MSCSVPSLTPLGRHDAEMRSAWVRLLKTFYSKKYGIEIVRFTRAKGNILHTATKVDSTSPPLLFIWRPCRAETDSGALSFEQIPSDCNL